MPFLCRRLSIPCGPVKISAIKLKTATQTMGDTSSPLNGFTTLLVAWRKGSVGL